MNFEEQTKLDVTYSLLSKSRYKRKLIKELERKLWSLREGIDSIRVKYHAIWCLGHESKPREDFTCYARVHHYFAYGAYRYFKESDTIIKSLAELEEESDETQKNIVTIQKMIEDLAPKKRD